MEIVEMISWTNKGGIGRWKIAEVREPIFSGDLRGGCMHK